MKNTNKKSNSYSNVNVLAATKAVRSVLVSIFLLMITLTGMAQPSNKCLSFNGSTSIVNFIDSDLVLSWNNNVVISAWVNWSNKANAGANAVIMEVSDSTGSNGQFWLQHNASNSSFQFVMQTDSLVKDTVNSNTNPVVGNWYNVAGVYDGGNLKMYVNGILEGTTAIPHGQIMRAGNSTFKMTMGASSKLTNQFNGLIDEVSIWNQPLVVNQPTTIYTFQTYMCKSITLTAKGLYAYWNMDTLHTDSVYDLIADADGYDEYNAVCSNVTVVQGGAPVGSSVTQLTGTGPFVYINTTTGDTLLIDSLSAAANGGVYVYQVNGVPTNTALPYGVSTTCPAYYYGIYIPGYQGTYSVSYYYHTTSCPGYRTTSSSSLVLLNRNPQTSFNWVNSNATVDVLGSKFSMVVSGGQNEFLMASEVNNTTGIATINNSLKVTGISPNPFSSNFNLTINCPKNANINARMMSADGKLISERMLNCNQGENQVNFENMNEIASGVYFLHLNDEDGYTSNVKMVKN